MARRPPVKRKGPPVKTPQRPNVPARRPATPSQVSAALVGGRRQQQPIRPPLGGPRGPFPNVDPVPERGTLGNPFTDALVPPATGPYQGAAGTEATHEGQQRVPPPDWADPSSPNYERRNYYTNPGTGEAVAREPGYYNPENPWDTGRDHERNDEFGRTYGYSADAIAPFERRMSEPGV